MCRGHRRVQSDPEWYQPSSLSGLAEIIASHRDSKLKLVAGSTGRGQTMPEGLLTPINMEHCGYPDSNISPQYIMHR